MPIQEKLHCIYFRPESSILDHLSKFFLRRKLPDAFHQVLVRVPVTSKYLKTSYQILNKKNYMDKSETAYLAHGRDDLEGVKVIK